MAKAKGEILEGQRRPDFAILNADDDYFDYWKSRVEDTTVISFGLSADAEVRASHIVVTERRVRTSRCTCPASRLTSGLHLAGRHNVLNACAAAAMATSALGLSPEQIRRGLEAVVPVGGRLQPVENESGAILFDDSYNANPVSVQAAAEFLAGQGGRSWLVLGDMAELGDDAELLHAHTGWVVREAGIDNLMATGPLMRHTVESFGEGGRWFESVDELCSELAGSISRGDVVLVKGSRSMGMERVVHALTDSAETVVEDQARSA